MNFPIMPAVAAGWVANAIAPVPVEDLRSTHYRASLGQGSRYVEVQSGG